MNLSTNPNGEYWGFGQYRQWQPPANTVTPMTTQTQKGTGMFGDPFGTAMSGMMKGTLQPYVNRMTQDANKALYGGLLDYQSSPIIAGDAGGTPINSTPPQGFNLQSALLNGEFGKRSWMK
jgi:hypothetical protein